jgi:anti-sigma factor RsiW
MKKQCEEIEKLLGAWLDRELNQFEAERVESHLQECDACFKEKQQLERIQDSLKRALELRASGLAFEPFWREVRRRILEQKPWYAELWDWIRFSLYAPRLTWAIPLVIVGLLGVLTVEQFVPGLGLGPARSNVAVESIDGHGLNVAVFRESKTKTTVIWLFENQEDEQESSGESASPQPSF